MLAVVDIVPAESILGIFTVLVTVEEQPPIGSEVTFRSVSWVNDTVKVTRPVELFFVWVLTPYLRVYVVLELWVSLTVIVKFSSAQTASPARRVSIVKVDGSVIVRVWVTRVEEQPPLSP